MNSHIYLKKNRKPSVRMGWMLTTMFLSYGRNAISKLIFQGM